MGASPKKTITLSDKTEVTVDVSTLKQREFAAFFNPSTTDTENNKVLARLCNVKTEFINELLRDDYRRIVDTAITLSNRPLDDPNSPSGSISP